MKASKTTNEALARRLETVTFNYDVLLRETMREAAARLRRPTPVDDDLLKMAKDLDAKDAEIAKLRTLTTHTDNSEVIAELERRLKVAEDCIARIAKIDTRPILPYTSLSIIRHRAKEALAQSAEKAE